MLNVNDMLAVATEWDRLAVMMTTLQNNGIEVRCAGCDVHDGERPALWIELANGCEECEMQTISGVDDVVRLLTHFVRVHKNASEYYAQMVAGGTAVNYARHGL